MKKKRFPCLDTVKLLIHCGAKVNCYDAERNSPLHTLAITFPAFRPSTADMLGKAEEITKLFINAGIHLDSVNIDGNFASRVCSSRKYLKKFNLFL
jgi:Fem-1 homolog b